MLFDKSLLTQAVHDSYKGHNKQDDVKKFKAHEDKEIDAMYAALMDGTWRKYISFHDGEVTNANGKHRKLGIPSLKTRMLEHLFLLIVVPIYDTANSDVGLARNCLPDHGITAKKREDSVLRDTKHMMYDLRQFHYILTLDQRQCYAHLTMMTYRRAMKYLFCLVGMQPDRELIDFGEAVSFPPDGHLPIGTPTSPYIHHIVMLESDKFIHDNTLWSLRYADDNIMAFETKEDLQAMKWRIANLWWYVYRMRVKRSSVRIVNIDKSTVDFCSYIAHRNQGKDVTEHDKGYTVVRRRTVRRAKKCKAKSWPSYYGILKAADCHKIILNIDKRMAKAEQLAEESRIERTFDAEPITPKDLLGIVHTVYDYRILKDGKGNPNWIQCLIGIPHADKETGAISDYDDAYEYHGNLEGIYSWFLKLEQIHGVKGFLPLEDAVLEHHAGYAYRHSTNVIRRIMYVNGKITYVKDSDIDNVNKQKQLIIK